MNANETSGQETDEPTRPAHRNELAAAADEKTLKRARWEHLRLAACSGTGRVNVCNLSYGVHEKADHTYTVTVERGQPTDCTCPAAKYQSGPCKHVVAVAADRAVLDEAMHGGSDSVRQYTEADDDANPAIVTDGGTVGEALEDLEDATGGTDTEQESIDLSREKRPKVHGYGPDVQRYADGSIRKVKIEVATGGYGDHSPPIRKLALTYYVNDGTAHVDEIESAHRDGDAIERKHLRMLALADDVVSRVPGVVTVEPFEREISKTRETYERDLRERCDEEGCYDMPDTALDSGKCREHTPREDR